MIDLMTMKTFFANFSENKNSLSSTSLKEFCLVITSPVYTFFSYLCLSIFNPSESKFGLKGMFIQLISGE